MVSKEEETRCKNIANLIKRFKADVDNLRAQPGLTPQLGEKIDNLTIGLSLANNATMKLYNDCVDRVFDLAEEERHIHEEQQTLYNDRQELETAILMLNNDRVQFSSEVQQLNQEQALFNQKQRELYQQRETLDQEQAQLPRLGEQLRKEREKLNDEQRELGLAREDLDGSHKLQEQEVSYIAL